MTCLLDAVRTLASPVLGSRRPAVAIRHRETGHLFGEDFGVDDLVAFADEAAAMRFIEHHACEPKAWETIPLAS